MIFTVSPFHHASDYSSKQGKGWRAEKRMAGARMLGDPPGLSVLLQQFIERVFGFQHTSSEANHVAF